jgi:hypothetical protein
LSYIETLLKKEEEEKKEGGREKGRKASKQVRKREKGAEMFG